MIELVRYWQGVVRNVDDEPSAAGAQGAVERVQPKMMTVVAIMAGLLPIMWSSGTGSEIMQRIAVPMIGRMVSSTLLSLIAIPAIFGLIKGFQLQRYGRTGGVIGPQLIEQRAME